MKALITGITGFVGSYLAEKLVEIGKYEVSGTHMSDDLTNVSSVKDKLDLHKVDLQNKQAVDDLINTIAPDVVFHLAALTSPAQSFDDPVGFITNNIIIEVNLFEAVKKAGISPKILIASSAEIYGAVKPEDVPINERVPFNPVNPYAVSKVAQDRLGYQYSVSAKMNIVIARPYNHVGPRQAPIFVVSEFAKKIADIEKGKGEALIKVGNLSAKRDFTDVRDVVRAYMDLIEKGEKGEAYNIGSGRSIKIEDILNKLLSFSEKTIKVEVDPAKLRPIDVPELVCDSSKIHEATGWQPEIDIDTTLKETLEYWRNQE